MMSKNVIFILLAFCEVHVGNSSDVSGEDNQEKFNVVMFFAKTSVDEVYVRDAGLTYLNFTAKTRVKQSLDDETFTSSKNDCKQMLKSSVISLISYCKNIMGMSTVIASMDNDSFSNSLRFKRTASEDPEIIYHHPKRSKGRIFYSFKPLRDKVLITAPEHTEVFKIRSKRQYHVAEQDKPAETLPGSNLMGMLMGTINLTFFGKLLDNPKTQSQSAVEQSNGCHGNSLFTLTRDSLSGVQDGASGFLMIVLGGNLSDIGDAYSDLVQSVKHVVENTEDRNTLMVVTGLCPDVDRFDDDRVRIPVYVRGVGGADGVTFTCQLYDVPYSVKNFLAGMTVVEGTYFGSVKTKRTRRDVPEEQKRSGNISVLPSSLLLITSQVYNFLNMC